MYRPSDKATAGISKGLQPADVIFTLRAVKYYMALQGMAWVTGLSVMVASTTTP